MKSNANPTIDNTVVDLQFDLTCICNGEMRRDLMSIPERDFELSVKCIRSLITTRLHIPLVCQIRLSLGDISLDCLESDENPMFLSRIQKRGERLPISLHYYTNCVPLKPMEKMLEQFDTSLADADFRLIYIILNSLNYEHMDQEGWESNAAMGTRIYLRNCDFLSKLLACIGFLNKGLSDIYQEFSKLQDQCGEEISQIMARTDSISTALDAALTFVWNFGAKSIDRIYLHRKGFLNASLESIRIAHTYLCSDFTSFKGFGKVVFSRCIGVIQGFSELRTPAIEIGYNQEFTALLMQSILGVVDFTSSDELNNVIQILIFFSISSQSEISHKLFCDGTYYNLVHHLTRFTLNQGFSNCGYELFYIGCLLIINMLKTPVDLNLVYSMQLFADIVTLFTKFLSTIKLEDIVKFEDYYKFIWGSLDPFTSFFFIPSNSLLGYLHMNSLPLYNELYNLYFRLALFSLNLLLSRDISRKQFLEENLLTHLVIAAWFVPDIFSMLTSKYPEITYLPVPSLYDIAVVQLVRQGCGNYTQLIHPPL